MKIFRFVHALITIKKFSPPPLFFISGCAGGDDGDVIVTKISLAAIF